MNLADHFFQLKEAFVTYSELSAWCAKHRVTSQDEKKELIKALREIGAKDVFIKWQGKEMEKAFFHIGLLDTTLWNDRDYWGKGVTIINI
jgi:ribosome-associated toxin RatA of RatAB toxin-antitoxin module